MSHECPSSCKKKCHKHCKKTKKNRHTLGSEKNPYDFIIVGAGTAGSPLAKLLSDNFDKSVLVLEGGQNLSTDPKVLAEPTPGSPPATPKYDWEHVADVADYMPAPFLNPVLYTDGRMWGGSSGHNFGDLWRGTPDVYNNAWAPVNPRWSYNSLLPAMKYLERFVPNGYVPNPAQRGLSGPLTVSQAPPISQANPFVAAFLAMNSPMVPDRNDPTLGDVGVSPNQITAVEISPGVFQRVWAASAFLGTDVVTPDGQGVGGRQLTIESAAYAKKVLLDGTRAVGVRWIRDLKNPQDIVDTFGKKIILAAGTIVDAAILQRSGIGPATLLTSLGIPVVVDNANVGANMECHIGPTVLTPINFADPPNNFPPDVPEEASSDISGRNVPVDGLIGAPTGIREFQYIPIPGPPFSIPLAVLTALNIPHDPNNDFYINWITAILRPHKLGTVEIQSADDIVEPLARFHFYQDVSAPGMPSELDKAVYIFKMVANHSLTYTGQMPIWPPAAHYPVTTGYPGAAAPDDSTLREDAKAVSIFFNHACGTCRMATSAATGVVDGNLDVFGVQGLSCCSNSVVPQSETGNTQWTAYIVGLIKAKIEGASVPF